LAAAVFGFEAGFFFAATAVTPSTDSFSALAGVKCSRVRAGILICSPVAGLRPTRAASLRLRKMPYALSRFLGAPSSDSRPLPYD
jgi:hypothetical protein